MALVNPHGGGALKPLLLQGEALKAELARAQTLPKIKVSSREKGDIIMLGIGGFTPLDGFMTHSDWQGVCDGMKTSSGLFWPIPITLSTDKATADALKTGGDVALLDPDSGEILATLKVTEKYAIDKAHECAMVFKTTDLEHPGVKMVMEQGDVNLAGPLKVLSQAEFPSKYGELFMTPAQTRALFESYGWSKVAAFQTRNPMHRSHEYLAKVAIETCDGVLIHSLLGNLKPGDIPADVRSNAIGTLADTTSSRRPSCRRLSARHALRRPARGAAARGVPPELRLLAPDRRPRPRRGGQLLRPVRRAPHLRRDPEGRAGDPAAEDRLDLLVLQVRRHGLGAHLPARRRRPPAGLRHQAAQVLSEGADVPPEFSRPEVLEILRAYYAGLTEKVEVKLVGHSAR
jgi:sulfate adenylyltransferase